jgi:glycosyltransferase involved in cell wall biosynthesis
MKILNICGYSWDIGGPPKIIYDHAIVQMKLGADVTILTPISAGQKLYAIPEGANIVTCKRHWFSKFWAEFSPELYHWIKAHGNEYDVIHIHGVWHFSGVAPYLAGIKTAKCITIHGLLDRWTIGKGYWKKYIFGLLFQKSILKNTELIQINNSDEREDLKRFLGFEHPNVKIVPNGMNLNDFAILPEKNTFRNQFQIPKEKQLILFMSRINLKKGLDLLLPAFKKVASQRNDCMLILAGPDDGYLSETENFIKENSLEKRIELVGMLTGKDKLSALSDADIFVLPSHSEGFSIATLEALISGVPSLLSDRVGFGETIRETNAAHLIELNEDSIVNGLNKMLDDKEYCQTLSKNGVSLVKNRYDIELVAKQLYSEFERIVKK